MLNSKFLVSIPRLLNICIFESVDSKSSEKIDLEQIFASSYQYNLGPDNGRDINNDEILAKPAASLYLTYKYDYTRRMDRLWRIENTIKI